MFFKICRRLIVISLVSLISSEAYACKHMAMLEKQVGAMIAQHFAPQTTSLEVLPIDNRTAANQRCETDSLYLPKLIKLAPDAPASRVHAWVAIGDQVIRLSYRLHGMVKTWGVTRDVEVGELLQAEMFSEILVPLTPTSASWLRRRPDKAILALTPLREGNPLMTAALTEAPAIAPGTALTVSSRAGKVELTLPGLALNIAKAGQVVRVRLGRGGTGVAVRAVMLQNGRAEVIP